jgi:hypothetical protein
MKRDERSLARGAALALFVRRSVPGFERESLAQRQNRSRGPRVDGPEGNFLARHNLDVGKPLEEADLQRPPLRLRQPGERAPPSCVIALREGVRARTDVRETLRALKSEVHLMKRARLDPRATPRQVPRDDPGVASSSEGRR